MSRCRFQGRAGLDEATMPDRAVSDTGIRTDRRLPAGEAMPAAIVLNVRSFGHADLVKIPAQADAGGT